MEDLPWGGGYPRETAAKTAYAPLHSGSGGKAPCERGDAAGGLRGGLASWCGQSAPRLRSVAGLRGRPATPGLRHGPDSYGRQQLGNFHTGRKPDGVTPRAGGRPSGRKPLLRGTRWTVPREEAPANYVPAAAVIRRGRALSGITGRKARVGGLVHLQ